MHGGIRLTTRQTFQFHGRFEAKYQNDAPDTEQIRHPDSIATAGDVNRNVLCTSNPSSGNLHQEAYEWAKRSLSICCRKPARMPKFGWMVKKLAPDEEPILGSTYLPRKVQNHGGDLRRKTISMHANDLNFVGDCGRWQVDWFQRAGQGGLAMTRSNKETLHVRRMISGFIRQRRYAEFAEAVVTTQRDWGNRLKNQNGENQIYVGTWVLMRLKRKWKNVPVSSLRPVARMCFTNRGDRFGWVDGN